jgi:hypothetical protein
MFHSELVAASDIDLDDPAKISSTQQSRAVTPILDDPDLGRSSSVSDRGTPLFLPGTPSSLSTIDDSVVSDALQSSYERDQSQSPFCDLDDMMDTSPPNRPDPSVPNIEMQPAELINDDENHPPTEYPAPRVQTEAGTDFLNILRSALANPEFVHQLTQLIPASGVNMTREQPTMSSLATDSASQSETLPFASLFSPPTLSQTTTPSVSNQATGVVSPHDFYANVDPLSPLVSLNRKRSRKGTQRQRYEDPHPQYNTVLAYHPDIRCNHCARKGFLYCIFKIVYPYVGEPHVQLACSKCRGRRNYACNKGILMKATLEVESGMNDDPSSNRIDKKNYRMPPRSWEMILVELRESGGWFEVNTDRRVAIDQFVTDDASREPVLSYIRENYIPLVKRNLPNRTLLELLKCDNLLYHIYRQPPDSDVESESDTRVEDESCKSKRKKSSGRCSSASRDGLSKKVQPLPSSSLPSEGEDSSHLPSNMEACSSVVSHGVGAHSSNVGLL